MSVPMLPKIDESVNLITRVKLKNLKAQLSVISKLKSIMREKTKKIIEVVNHHSLTAIKHLNNIKKQLLSDMKSAVFLPTLFKDAPLLKDYVIQSDFENPDQVLSSISKFFSLDYSKIVREIPNYSCTNHEPFTAVRQLNNSGTSLFQKSNDVSERLRILELQYGLNVWHPGEVTCIGLFYDSNRLVSAGKDGALIIWDMTDWSILKVIEHRNSSIKKARNSEISEARKSVIRALCISDAGLIYSGSSDGNVNVFSVRNYEELYTKKLEDGVSCFCLDNSQRRLLVGTDKGVLNVIDTKNYECKPLTPEKSWTRRIFDDIESKILCILVTSDGKCALTSCTNGNILIWDLVQLSYKSVFNTKSYITSLILTPDNQSCIYSTNNGKILIWNLLNNKEEAVLSSSSKEPITCIVIMPDGNKLISGGPKNIISIWSLETYKLLTTLEKHKERVSMLKVLKNDHFVAADDSGVMLLWCLETNIAIEMSGHCRPVGGFEISPDKTTLFSFSDDGVIKVNSFENEVVKELVGHKGTVKHVQLNFNNGLVYSAGGTDGCVRVWDPATGRQIMRANQHLSGKSDEGINQLIVSDSGDIIVSSSSVRKQILIYNKIDLCKEREFFHENDYINSEKKYPELEDFILTILRD